MKSIIDKFIFITSSYSARIMCVILSRDEHSKGRKTYEMIPEVGTKVMWPKTRDTATSYCRILLHDTLLKSYAFRTGISISSVCECGYDSETVEHFILHCPKYDSARSQLI